MTYHSDAPDFPEMRAARPHPTPPDAATVKGMRDKLLAAIAEAKAAAAVVPETAAARPPASAKTRRQGWTLRRRVLAAGLAAAAAVALTALGLGLSSRGQVHIQPEQATAQSVLLGFATQAARSPAVAGAGDIRHVVFRNLTDPGAPTYEQYIRPDGTAMVAEVGGRLEATDGFITRKVTAGLSSDPAVLREQLLKLAPTLGYSGPGEVPERGLYRLAVDLLADPSVTSAVKASVFRVLAGLSVVDVRARQVGTVVDQAGRTGSAIDFLFGEGATDRLIVDPKTGALLDSTTTLADGSLLGGQVYLRAGMVDSIPSTTR